MKNKKSNTEYIIIFVICIVCSYFSTIAIDYAFQASDVRFNNTSTGLESANLQDALDEVYYHVSDYNEIKTAIGSTALTTTAQTIKAAINEVKNDINSHFLTLGTSSNPITDLDDIPLNSIGNVTLDASVSPSGVLRSHSYWKAGTETYSNDRYTIVAIDQYDFRVYMYDMYESTSKGWRVMTQKYRAKNATVATGTNLNNILESGSYVLSSSNTYTNMPDGKTAGILVVLSPFASNTWSKQVFYQGGVAIYVRTRTGTDGTEWSNWYKYSGTAV